MGVLTESRRYCFDKLYIKVLYNYKNNCNNKKGGVWLQGARFYPTQSQVGEKNTENEEKAWKKNCVRNGIGTNFPQITNHALNPLG